MLHLVNGLVTGGYRDLLKVAGMERAAAGEAEEGRAGGDGMMR